MLLCVWGGVYDSLVCACVGCVFGGCLYVGVQAVRPPICCSFLDFPAQFSVCVHVNVWMCVCVDVCVCGGGGVGMWWVCRWVGGWVGARQISRNTHTRIWLICRCFSRSSDLLFTALSSPLSLPIPTPFFLFRYKNEKFSSLEKIPAFPLPPDCDLC
jgi:hypothetical protein